MPSASTWTHSSAGILANEFTYTPPTAAQNDDGLTFPLSYSDAVLRSQWHGEASTINPLNLQLYQLQLDQVVHDAVTKARTQIIQQTPDLSAIVPVAGVGFVPPGGTTIITYPVTPFYDIQVAVQSAVLKSQLQGTGLWYELVLKPLTNGPFSTYYVIDSLPMQVPQTINLS